VRTALARLQSFAERFARGLAPRMEGEIRIDPPETGPGALAALATETAGGALVARVIWTDAGTDHAASLLWVGDLARLLGEGGRAVLDLKEEEVASLDASLRLAVEEGAEGEMPFEWSALELVSADGLLPALREVGAADAPERARVAVHLQQSEMAFLLVPAAASAGEPTLREAVLEETRATLPDPDATADRVARLAESHADAPAETTAGPPPAPADDFRNLGHLLDVRLPLTIRLGSTRMPLDDVLRLAPGAIVELDRGEDEPLDVLANGRVIARGEVVVVDERFGLRITEIGSREERLRATV
jgi:flagellar motor switch protein FliN/FliY